MPLELERREKLVLNMFLTKAFALRGTKQSERVVAHHIGKLRARVNMLEAEVEMLKEKLKGATDAKVKH